MIDIKITQEKVKLVDSMEWSVSTVNREMIRDYVEHIFFRFSSEGCVSKIS